MPPTEAVPTASSSTLGNLEVQVSISVGKGAETLNATITGNGDVTIIIANTLGNDPSRWAPLVDALSKTENLRIVTFTYRGDEDGHITDTIAVFDYLRAEGIDKIICIGAGPGSTACAGLKNEPQIIGIVFFAGFQIPAIEADFPKLFLTADADPLGAAGPTERAHEQSAEPKVFKYYSAGVHGPALFFIADVGLQVLADVTDFIDEIVNGQ